MSNLVPASNGVLARLEAHAAGRELSRLELSGSLGLARIEEKAQLEAAKAHAVGYVGQQALNAVAMVSQLEGQLGAACPMAVTRLQGIADITALSIAQVVGDAARKLQ